jgi:hypothetical protein
MMRGGVGQQAAETTQTEVGGEGGGWGGGGGTALRAVQELDSPALLCMVVAGDSCHSLYTVFNTAALLLCTRSAHHHWSCHVLHR